MEIGFYMCKIYNHKDMWEKDYRYFSEHMQTSQTAEWSKVHSASNLTVLTSE